jgi:hypothetical protein
MKADAAGSIRGKYKNASHGRIYVLVVAIEKMRRIGSRRRASPTGRIRPLHFKLSRLGSGNSSV